LSLLERCGKITSLNNITASFSSTKKVVKITNNTAIKPTTFTPANYISIGQKLHPSTT